MEPALARPPPSNKTCSVTATSLVHSILDWLRAGYPQGVPGPDRVPLLSLLLGPQGGVAWQLLPQRHLEA